jgi:hypothetical protein
MPCSYFHSRAIPRLTKPATHQQVVDHYIRYQQPDFIAELDWFRSQPTLVKAIREAALARDSRGKRLSHQRRLLRPVTPAAWRKLRLRQRQLESCKNFSQLYRVVERALSSIYGAGPLYSYDTALRLGAFLDISPCKVFLQSGSLQGAMKPSVGGGRRSRTMALNRFPSAFQVLEPCEMENLLCVYRDYL